MACFHPVLLRNKKGATEWLPLIVPCGRCVGCALDYARSWSVRCYHETFFHKESYFATFTIADEHLHASGPGCMPTVDPVHMPLFFRSLRRRGFKCRYFYAAEYGERTHRPHYHAIIFGLNLIDLKPVGRGYSRSDFLESVWGRGGVLLASVTPENIAYTCQYTVKKARGRDKQWYFDRGLVPEFVRMSRCPGIGRDFFDKYRGDLYNTDSCLLPGGFKAKVPRYYDKVLEGIDPNEFLLLKAVRLERAGARFDESRPDRLFARESVALSKLRLRDSSSVF